MLFYPLWVLFWQFSCEPSVPPLPVGVDKGWLKPPCAECIEHMLAHVYHMVWFVHYEWTNMCTDAALSYRKVLKIILYIRKPFSVAACPSFAPAFITYLFSVCLFLSHNLDLLYLPVPSSVLPFPSSTSIWLLCLRELASKLSAVSGLKAISSASLPLQVRAWDW